MSYQADKPFGRRKTDQTISPDERRRLQLIRRDVEQDSSGLIRRYLRLSEKMLDVHPADESTPEASLKGANRRPAREVSRPPRAA